MKSNFQELFNERIAKYKSVNDIDINSELDEIMSELKIKGRVTKTELLRQVIRNKLTTALNKNEIYSHEKGFFVFIKNANEKQLSSILAKAEKDRDQAETRRANAESFLMQIKMAWDESGNFIGFKVPEAKEVNKEWH